MRFFAEFTLSEANGLRMTLCVRLPRLRAVTHSGVQARAMPSQRPSVGLPRLGAVTPACTKRFGEGRHFGVQARSPAKAGSLAMTY